MVNQKQILFVGSSLDNLRVFPDDVKDVIGYALHIAQGGKKHPDAKPLKGCGSGVLEVLDNHDGDTYRAVYTVHFSDYVFVLHCFQKKSKKGIKTPKQDMELIESRLKWAQEIYQELKQEVHQ